MCALPKRKHSKARQRKKRTHLKVTLPTLVPCPQCHNFKPPYQVCPVCGTYRGRQAIEIKSTKKRE